LPGISRRWSPRAKIAPSPRIGNRPGCRRWAIWISKAYGQRTGKAESHPRSVFEALGSSLWHMTRDDRKCHGCHGEGDKRQKPGPNSRRALQRPGNGCRTGASRCPGDQADADVLAVAFAAWLDPSTPCPPGISAWDVVKRPRLINAWHRISIRTLFAGPPCASSHCSVRRDPSAVRCSMSSRATLIDSASPRSRRTATPQRCSISVCASSLRSRHCSTAKQRATSMAACAARADGLKYCPATED